MGLTLNSAELRVCSIYILNVFDFVVIKSFFHVFALQRVGFEKIFDVGFFVDGKNAKGYLSYQLLTHGSKDNKNVRFISIFLGTAVYLTIKTMI